MLKNRRSPALIADDGTGVNQKPRTVYVAVPRCHPERIVSACPVDVGVLTQKQLMVDAAVPRRNGQVAMLPSVLCRSRSRKRSNPPRLEAINSKFKLKIALAFNTSVRAVHGRNGRSACGFKPLFV